MENIFVKKGAMAASSNPDTWLEARSLGSTLCVCARDPVAAVAAMTVIVLPKPISRKNDSAGISLDIILDAPGGLTRLMRRLLEMGAKRKNLTIWLVGAATFMEEPQDMALGAQVYTAVRTILQENKVLIKGEHVGGPYNRSVRMTAGGAGPNITAPGLKEVAL
ncbi:MAG: chemotaxis protein CheD [Dissulfurimicrobium sp.]|uniref:chemotaxis protein CheD n=1 Tax=Dissulfurimicrobium sp. TaxID=2022436 RepID=UPI00404921B3